jgi:phage baseplate assembly protein W
MPTFTFKSAGITADQTEITKTAIAPSRQPLNIKTPLRKTQSGDGLFEVWYNDQFAESIRDNLKNLLMTNHGERFINFFFGADLKPLMSEFVALDENFENEVESRIRESVTRWMPYVSLENFSLETDHDQNTHYGVLKLSVNYAVPILDLKNQSLQVLLNVL